MLQPIVDCVVLLVAGRLLLALSCWLWDLYFTRCCIDKSCPLPLPPGSMGWPIIGETISAIKNPQYSEKSRTKYGNVYKSHQLGVPVVRVCGGENMKKVIQGEGDIVAQFYPAALRTLLGNKCLINQLGDKHDQLHRTIRKCFSHDTLEGFIPHIQEMLQDQLLARWCDKLGDFGAWEECRRLVFTLACYSMVGLNFEEDEVDCLYKNFVTLFKGFFTVKIPAPGTTYCEAMKSRNIIREKIRKALKETTSNPNSMLSQVKKLYKESQEDEETCLQLCTELMSFGHETTSGTFTALIYQLASHPDVTRRIRAEIDEHYSLDARSSEPLTLSTLNKMSYIDAVVKESMRILPPVAGFYRKVTKTFELEGYQIPKGWYVTLLIKDTHAVTDVFKNKTEFDPDRWQHQTNNSDTNDSDTNDSDTNDSDTNDSDTNDSDTNNNDRVVKNSNYELANTHACPQQQNNLKNRRVTNGCPLVGKRNSLEGTENKSPMKCPYDFMPFGRGKRICVGKDYASMVLKIFTIELVRNCDWVIHNPNPIFQRVPSLVPIDGLPVTFNRLMKTSYEE